LLLARMASDVGKVMWSNIPLAITAGDFA